jgi:hypothetical protein
VIHRPTGSARHDHDDRAVDLDALLHPALAFEHPMNVVNDPDLTLSEKRAILASWASDACAVEAAPALRHLPGAAKTVQFDDIMDALRLLDRQETTYRPKPRYRQILARRGMPGLRRRPRGGNAGDEGVPLG